MWLLRILPVNFYTIFLTLVFSTLLSPQTTSSHFHTPIIRLWTASTHTCRSKKKNSRCAVSWHAWCISEGRPTLEPKRFFTYRSAKRGYVPERYITRTEVHDAFVNWNGFEFAMVIGVCHHLADSLTRWQRIKMYILNPRSQRFVSPWWAVNSQSFAILRCMVRTAKKEELLGVWWMKSWNPQRCISKWKIGKVVLSDDLVNTILLILPSIRFCFGNLVPLKYGFP